MYKHDHSKYLAGAAIALSVLVGGQAQAQTTKLTSPTFKSTPTSTAPYTGASQTAIPGPFTLATGNSSVNVTFSETNPNNTVFSRFDSRGLAFPDGTRLIETADLKSNALGPLNVAFSTPVVGFGLDVQSAGFDQETFTLSVFNGNTLLNTYTYGSFDNTVGRGVAPFVGAEATGNTLITGFTISSTSIDQGVATQFTNNFFADAVQVEATAPVPEASTMVSFGAGVLLFGGLLLGAHRRKASGRPRSGQTAG